MKKLMAVLLVVVFVSVPVVADNLVEELVPDETSMALMAGKDLDLKAKGMASYELADAFTLALFVDVWNLTPVGAGLRIGQTDKLIRIGVGHDGEQDSAVVYIRQVVRW